MREDCREEIVSDDYLDLIWRLDYGSIGLEEEYDSICTQPLGGYYISLYLNRERYGKEVEPYIFSFHLFPDCYTPLQTESLEQSGILDVRNQPVLGLRGEGVILGFVDTGIDYRNDCFRDFAGRSRILEIWDQSYQEGMPPEEFSYGSVYTRENINEALRSENPFSVVPERDESGHGTILASIAAGSENEEENRSGAAPLSDIAVVKLKPAKPYLKEFFRIPESAEAYQENDIMAGIHYLNQLALREGKPLVLCLALGSNMGGHTGTNPLSDELNSMSGRPGRAAAVAAGNEANQGHHYFGRVEAEGAYDEAELRVPPGEPGLMLELWGSSPDVFSVSLISPTGESIPRIYLRSMETQTYGFVFERTRVSINFALLEARSGDQVLVIRMSDPMEGVWKIRVYGNSVLNGEFHMWLPVTGFISPETRFLLPDPNTTLTEPANAAAPISTAGYNGNTGGIYIDSGRGYTRKGRIKPDLAAPAVAVEGVAPNNRVTEITGTSAAAAITAGAAALMMEWGLVNGEYILVDGIEIKNHFIRGAQRSRGTEYPNREWGYGKLNLYESFDTFRRPRPE